MFKTFLPSHPNHMNGLRKTIKDTLDNRHSRCQSTAYM